MGHDPIVITPADVRAQLAAFAQILNDLEGGLRAIRTTLLASIEKIAAMEAVDRELRRLEAS